MREKRQAQQEEASPERVSHRCAAAVPHSVVTDSPDRALQLRTLIDAPIYWTARAMQEQGSRFFQALGMALEAADLRLVGEFLGLDADTVNGAISSRPPRPAAEGRGQTNELARLPPGTTVCFTGTLYATVLGAPITRDQAHLLATRAGLVVLEGVSKKLDVLIVADPQSASGKAQKARSYGTRIIAEAVFWRSIGAETD